MSLCDVSPLVSPPLALHRSPGPLTPSPRQLLVVDQTNFKAFSEIVPKFRQMLSVNAEAYDKM